MMKVTKDPEKYLMATPWFLSAAHIAAFCISRHNLRYLTSCLSRISMKNKSALLSSYNFMMATPTLWIALAFCRRGGVERLTQCLSACLPSDSHDKTALILMRPATSWDPATFSCCSTSCGVALVREDQRPCDHLLLLHTCLSRAEYNCLQNVFFSIDWSLSGPQTAFLQLQYIEK